MAGSLSDFRFPSQLPILASRLYISSAQKEGGSDGLVVAAEVFSYFSR